MTLFHKSKLEAAAAAMLTVNLESPTAKSHVHKAPRSAAPQSSLNLCHRLPFEQASLVPERDGSHGPLAICAQVMPAAGPAKQSLLHDTDRQTATKTAQAVY